MAVFTALVLTVLSLVGGASAGEPRVRQRDPAVFFWYHFRTAILAENVQLLRDTTRFPFETTAADGSVTRHSRGSFSKIFRELLEAPSGTKGKTMRDLIAGKEDLSEKERTALKNEEIRIGCFRIATKKETCLFVGADLGTGTVAEKKAPSPAKELPPAPTDPTPVPLASTPVVRPPKAAEAEVPVPAEEAVEEEPPLENLARSEPETTAVVPASPIKLVKKSKPKPEEPRKDLSFRFYWNDFRKAALDNEVETIKSLTRFAFETKGPLEGDKTKKYVVREFDLLWPRLLEADPHAWGPLRDSMKEMIARREEPSVEEMATEQTGQIQVGVFIFRKIRDRWFFTRAILPE